VSKLAKPEYEKGADNNFFVVSRPFLLSFFEGRLFKDVLTCAIIHILLLFFENRLFPNVD